MLNLSIETIIENIQKKKTFTAISEDNSFLISIEKYLPYLTTAIHNGGNVAADVLKKMRLSSYERWYEEDPFTGEFIEGFPLRIIVYDSRFFYDLNRSRSECIYETAWGKEIWNEPLSDEQKAAAYARYDAFYSVLNALVKKLEELFGGCVVYDIHSYNYQRESQAGMDLPLFNLGTKNVKRRKYAKVIDHWIKALSKIRLPHSETRSAENEVFFGEGQLLKHLSSKFKKTLVLATEIKKLYCNENSGEEYPQYIYALSRGLKKAVLENAKFFIDEQTKLNVKQKYKLLTANNSGPILKADAALSSALRKLELLYYVNPVNIEQEKKRFFKSGYRHEPRFAYRPLTLDPYALKQKIFSIDIDSISDVSVQQMYRKTIEDNAALVDMLMSRGRREFFYNSLKLYGEPEDSDIKNASYLLHTADIKDEDEQQLNSGEAIKLLKQRLCDYGFKFNIESTANLSAKAMVLNSKRTLKLRKSAVFTLKSVEALARHELGIHALTTMNSRLQPLKIVSIGLPGDTETQEGLAILSEYLSGFISITRLKELAMRVMAVNMLVKGMNFRNTFLSMKEEYGMEEDSAFYLCTRVFRGGGFTKDYVYLRGFKKLFDFYKNDSDISPLLVGKSSLRYYEMIKELISRGILKEPEYIPYFFSNKRKEDPIIDYIIKSLD